MDPGKHNGQTEEDRRREERTNRIIADSERLIEEARAAIAAGERLYAEAGVEPGELMELVRRIGGDQAVRKIEEEVETSMQRIREESERRFQHMQFEQLPPARRPRFRSNMI
ncbi:MAG: hypothetical protein ACO1N5_17755 [Noviherbaspirillum sp.]